MTTEFSLLRHLPRELEGAPSFALFAKGGLLRVSTALLFASFILRQRTAS